MTDEMMILRTLLEKSSDADLLREMVGFAAHRLMELEVESVTGAAHCRTPALELATARRYPRCRLSRPARRALTSKQPGPSQKARVADDGAVRGWS
jgi:hypothetical protein